MTRNRDRWNTSFKAQARNEPNMPGVIFAHEFVAKARDILATPEQWTTGTLARDSKHRPTSIYSPEATCFCLTGAMLLARYRLVGAYDYHYAAAQQRHLDRFWTAVRLAVVESIGSRSLGISFWNDVVAREHHEVLQLLDRAERLAMEAH